jgi:ligand-binding sensor domain-containing protein
MKFTKFAAIFFIVLITYVLHAQDRPDFEWEFYGNFGNINDFELLDSVVLVATNYGLIEYQYASGIQKIYQSDHYPFPCNEFNAIYAESPSRMWMGSSYQYIYLKEQDNWVVYNLNDLGIGYYYTTCISKDSAGNVWFGLSNATLLKYDGQGWNMYDYHNIPYLDTKKIVALPDSTVWFLERSGHRIYLLIDNQFQMIWADSIGMSVINDMDVDPQGRLWIVGDSVFTYNSVKKIWEKQDINYWNGKNYECAKISFSPDGTIWYWLHSAGLFRDDGITRDSLGIRISNYGFYTDMTKFIAEDAQNVWYAYQDQLYHYNYQQDTTTVIRFYKGIPESSFLNMIENPDGTLWINTGEKIYSYDGNQFMEVNLDVLDTMFQNVPVYIQEMAVDSKGIKWLLVENSIVKIAGNEFSKINLDSLPLSSSKVSHIVVDSSNHLWAVSSDLVRFDGQTWQVYDLKLSYFFYTKFLETGPDNEVWFFLNGTLYKYHNEHLDSVGYGSYTLSMCVDRKGNVWMVPNDAGVDMYDGSNWFHYTPEDEIVTVGASFDTTVWVGSYDGNIYHYREGQWISYRVGEDLGFPTCYDPLILIADTRENIWIAYDPGVLIRIKELTTLPIKNIVENIPSKIVLYQNYPNPFNPQTQIKFTLRQAGKTKLTIYNLVGQKIRTLVNQFLPPGEHWVIWDGNNEKGTPAASGIYIYELRQGNYMIRKKMVLIR